MHWLPSSLKKHKIYFSNFSWLFLEKILKLGLGMTVTVWVARYLEPENFGALSYALSVVSILSVLSALGLDSIVTKQLVTNSEKKEIILGTALTLKLSAAAISYGIAFSILNFTNDKHSTIIAIIALTLLPQSFNVIDFYFQSLVKSKFVALANAITTTAASSIKTLLILANAPLLYFAIATVIESTILASLLISFHTKFHRKFPKWRFNWNTAFKLLKSSWPLIPSGLAVILSIRADQIMIKHLLGAASVGQYTASVRIIESMYFIPIIISSTLFPSIIKWSQKDKSLYNKKLTNLYSVNIWLAIAIATPISLFSTNIVSILYGNSYNASSTALAIYAWACIPVFLGVSHSKHLIAKNLIRQSLYRVIFGLTVNILGNIFLIPKLGINGAAVSTALGQLAMNLLYDTIDKKLRGDLPNKLRAFNPMHAIKAL